MEKVIPVMTRDFGNMLIQESWDKGYREKLKPEIGWEYSHVIYHRRGGTVRVYRLEREVQEDFHDAVYHAMKQNGWLENSLKNSVQIVKEIKRRATLLEEGKLEKMNVNVLCGELEWLVEKHAQSFPGQLFAYWIPIWFDQEGKNTGEDNKIIESIKPARRETEGIYDLVDSVLGRVLKALAKKMGVDEKLADRLSMSEIERLVETNALPSGVEKRLGEYVFSEGKFFEEPFEHYLKRHSLFVESDFDERKKELHGRCGNPGVAQGRVRVVISKKDIPLFENGEILVTPMTTPDFVPAMKKAAAIVTDEGGVLCHAVIVSRELGLPCIIATKHATKLFKNGDAVKVDATNGIVRKE